MDKKKIRTISEEFYSRSPNTQAMVRFYVSGTPTSKYKKEYTNMDKFNESSADEKCVMIQFGLVSPTLLK